MTKITELFETICSKKELEWEELLHNGNLFELEKDLQLLYHDIHSEIMSILLTKVGTSKRFKEKLEQTYEDQGVKDLRQRENSIQLITGKWVTYKSYYARGVKVDYELNTRHLSEVYWSCINKASFGYVNIASIYRIMLPSFEIGKEILKLHNIKIDGSRMRKLGIEMGRLGHTVGIQGILQEEESLENKRVVISFDGGRSRTREENGRKNKRGNAKYNTPWREPKIIVIQVINEKGELERKKSIPFYYGTMKSTASAMKKLEKALILLNAKEAAVIQFISDGAKSIWNNIKKVIKGAGIAFSKVTFTLDYYHAVQHLKALSLLLPYDEKQQNVVFEEWKEMLWEGLAKSIVRDFKKRIKNAKISLSSEMKTAIKYFIRHQEHMKYKYYKRHKLLSGSGLVESAVRRIINLRFKNTSSFWKIENLENLILLRCVFLADRWRIMLKNIELSLKKLGTI